MNAIKKIAVCAALALVGFTFLACTPEKPSFQSIDLTGASYAQGFSLADQHGNQRTLKDFSGKVVVVFFGFTQCPDVCPTTLAEMVQIKKQLGARGDKLQVVFISLDPERDTPEILKAYMAGFDSSFVALRPTLAQLPEVAKEFKIYYKKVAGKTASSYTLDHSAGSYVFDAQGRLRLYHRYGGAVQGLAGDIGVLLN